MVELVKFKETHMSHLQEKYKNRSCKVIFLDHQFIFKKLVSYTGTIEAPKQKLNLNLTRFISCDLGGDTPPTHRIFFFKPPFSDSGYIRTDIVKKNGCKKKVYI